MTAVTAGPEPWLLMTVFTSNTGCLAVGLPDCLDQRSRTRRGRALPLRIESDRLAQISDRFLMPSVMEMNLPAAGQRIDVAHIQLQSAGVGLYGQVQLIEPLIDRAQMAIVEAIERLGRDQPLIDLPGLREPPRGEQVVTDFGDLVERLA